MVYYLCTYFVVDRYSSRMQRDLYLNSNRNMCLLGKRLSLEWRGEGMQVWPIIIQVICVIERWQIRKRSVRTSVRKINTSICQRIKKKQSIENQSFSFMFVMKHDTLNWYEVVFVIILHSQTLPTEFLTYYLQILSLTFYMKT